MQDGDDADVGTFGPNYSGIHHNVEECAAGMVKAGAKGISGSAVRIIGSVFSEEGHGLIRRKTGLILRISQS